MPPRGARGLRARAAPGPAAPARLGRATGEVPEWLNGRDWKSRNGGQPRSRVRIPPSPLRTAHPVRAGAPMRAAAAPRPGQAPRRAAPRPEEIAQIGMGEARLCDSLRVANEMSPAPRRATEFARFRTASRGRSDGAPRAQTVPCALRWRSRTLRRRPARSDGGCARSDPPARSSRGTWHRTPNALLCRVRRGGPSLPGGIRMNSQGANLSNSAVAPPHAVGWYPMHSPRKSPYPLRTVSVGNFSHILPTSVGPVR